VSPANRPLRWYAACRAFLLLPDALRRGITRQTLAHYRRIRTLPPDLGDDLDHRAAPLAIFRWVAWGATDAEQRARHALAVERHTRTGHWPGARERARGSETGRRAA
jgi:hypothetical protein